jgi:putative sigma-54 modulation protein
LKRPLSPQRSYGPASMKYARYGGQSMEFQIEGRHFKVTDAIDQHAREKLGKLEHYFENIHRLHVILAVENTKRHVCELVCHVGKRHTLFAKGESDDMYVAIDKADKKMIAEIKKYKEKLRGFTRESRRGAQNVETVSSNVVEDDEE